jgi:hypothetical protein
MAANTKNAAALIVAGLRGRPGADPDAAADTGANEDGAKSEGLQTAAEDVLSAIKADDAQALTEALQAFIQMM